MDLVNENVVILANHFNPSIVSDHWLIKREIVVEGEISPNHVFTPAIVQFSTPRYELLLVEDRLQLGLRKDSNDTEKAGIARTVIGKFVETLPETPYTAIGINFDWQFSVSDPYAVGRKLFVCDSSPLSKVFASSDARFGGYFSKSLNSFRMKLTAMPIQLPDKSERINFAFNFHSPVGDVSQIQSRLDEWLVVKREALSTLELIEGYA
jgi:hypothetical protein